MRKMFVKILLVLTLFIMTTGSIAFAEFLTLKQIGSETFLPKHKDGVTYEGVIINGPIETGKGFYLRVAPGYYIVKSVQNKSPEYLTIKNDRNEAIVKFDSEIEKGVGVTFTGEQYRIATSGIGANFKRTITFIKSQDPKALSSQGASDFYKDSKPSTNPATDSAITIFEQVKQNIFPNPVPAPINGTGVEPRSAVGPGTPKTTTPAATSTTAVAPKNTPTPTVAQKMNPDNVTVSVNRYGANLVNTDRTKPYKISKAEFEKYLFEIKSNDYIQVVNFQAQGGLNNDQRQASINQKSTYTTWLNNSNLQFNSDGFCEFDVFASTTSTYELKTNGAFFLLRVRVYKDAVPTATAPSTNTTTATQPPVTEAKPATDVPKIEAPANDPTQIKEDNLTPIEETQEPTVTSSSLEGIKDIQISFSGATLSDGKYFVVKGSPLSLKVKNTGKDKTWVGLFLNGTNIAQTNKNFLCALSAGEEQELGTKLSSRLKANSSNEVYLASYGGSLVNSSRQDSKTSTIAIQVVDKLKTNNIKATVRINNKIPSKNPTVYQEALIRIKLTGLMSSNFAIIEAKDSAGKVVGYKSLIVKNSATEEELVNIKDLKITTKGSYKLSYIVGYAANISSIEKALASNDKTTKEFLTLNVEDKNEILACNIDGKIIVLSPKKSTRIKYNFITLSSDKYIYTFENEEAAKTAMSEVLGYTVSFKYFSTGAIPYPSI